MNVIDWLLDSDPAIRWQVMRDLLHEPDAVVAAERSKVTTEGWGARLLALQDEDGYWGREELPAGGRPAAGGSPAAGTTDPATRALLRELHGLSFEDIGGFLGTEPDVIAEWERGEPDPRDERSHRYWSAVEWMWNVGTLRPEWTSTTHTLVLLHAMGLDPDSLPARLAIGLVRDNCKWDHDGQDYFDGEVEPCINGKTVMLGAYFGQNVDAVVARLLSEQLEDGGWNCEAERGSTRSSFHSTIEVLDGLLEYELAGGGLVGVTAARLRAQEYLLERNLFRRLSDGEVIKQEWKQFSFPTRWHYDVLRGLDYLRRAGAKPDTRCAEAIELVESKRQANGRWLLENSYPGRVHFALDEGDGSPSRWNTLRALRVLEWYQA